ncbi:MAG: DUF4129 domain-containing protein [Archangium sp.]
MAVDALELKPRNSVALFDAAVRLSVTSAGLWAITLPSGAFLVGALFTMAEAIRRGTSLLLPVAMFTLAWMFRAITQGAACHYADQQVLGTTPPSVRASLRAALKRAPGLVTASAWLLIINTLLWTVTLGVGFLFVGAHTAAYAVVMRGEGSVLGLYGTSAKLLGPTRFVAPFVRLCGLSQLLLAVNLQVMTMLLLSLLRTLFGFDVTFIDRFASLDNMTWVATIAAITFSLFEPIRAASAALLLIDGRVRQEGLDLIAQVEQLPQRSRPRGVLLTIALIALTASNAFAENALVRRAERISEDCDMRVDLAPLRRGWADEDQSSLARMLARIENRIEVEEDCVGAESDLRESLRLYAELQAAPPTIDAQDTAKKILERPEFQVTPPQEEEKDVEADEPGWFAKLIREFLEWLFKREPKERENTPDVDVSAPSMGAANAVMIGAIVLVVVVLLVILIRSMKLKDKSNAVVDETNGLSQQPLAHDAMSALSRPSETWAGLADELAAKGEYREAIRHLYLALLSRLHRDGVIDYDPTFSNWEYLFAFKGSSSSKTAFKELTRRFDFAWYGKLGVDALAWSMFRQITEPLLVPSVEGANARA